MKPRHRLEKDSICYGCQYYKAVEELDYEPDPDDVQYGGCCDCKEPCFWGNKNSYEDYLLEPEKFFRNRETNRSELIEKLKEIQKVKKG